MKKEMVCIVCPMGCHITVELDGKEVKSVTGNTCVRGENYAVSECTNPMRTITSTVRTANNLVIPVKTDRPVPKTMIFECMKVINGLHPDKNNVATGNIILENILNTGANIVVTGKGA